MKLTQIDILKYKSLKSPISIHFNDGESIILIGKNGSGKTNILEAIKYSLAKNSFYGRDKIECEVKYHIELTDEESEEYFTCIEAKEKSKEIIVDFNGNNLEQRLISSSAIWFEAENFKSKLDAVLSRFETASKKYIKALQKLETDPNYFGNYLDVKVEEGDRGSLSYLMENHVKWVIDSVERQIEDIKRYIATLFAGDKISLMRYGHIRPYDLYSYNIKLYKIAEDEQIKISPIIASSLGITKDALNRANKKLNKKIRELNKILENQFSEMQNQLNEYKRIRAEIASIFDAEEEKRYEQNENLNKHFKSILQKIKEVVFCNCYFLDNENSLIFHNSINRQYHNDQISQEYLNSRNPIIEAFDMVLRDNGIIDEKTSILQKEQIDDKTIAKAIKVLNTHFLPRILPKFDDDEIINFEVRLDNGSLDLFVHEKSGEIVSFNNTSLGRRWYLTYQFVKALLKPGDMLLVDEPAAFLHPQAQSEFKKELELLAKQRVRIIYSTHSPYMIPENWEQIYNVVMTDKGTKVEGFQTSDELCNIIKNELGVNFANDILFNLSKIILLVEGVADKVCIEKFAELLNYNLNDYHIHVCDGEAILQVAYVCLKYKAIKLKVVLDNDNKNKNDAFKRGHSMYDECIKLLENNSERCVFIGNGGNGCLEDLFVEQENAKYKHYKNQKGQWKVDAKAVKALKSIDEISEQTRNNFEQLFIRLGVPKLDEAQS